MGACDQRSTQNLTPTTPDQEPCWMPQRHQPAKRERGSHLVQQGSYRVWTGAVTSRAEPARPEMEEQQERDRDKLAYSHHSIRCYKYTFDI